MYFDKLFDLGIKLRRKSGQEKTTCPQCSESRRNKKDPCLSVNITEGSYCCHNCGWKGSVKDFKGKKVERQYNKPDQFMLQQISLNDKVVDYFKNRGISNDTLKHFFVHSKEEFMPQTQNRERCIIFPYLRGGDIINAKYRDARKNFKLVKDAELIFFGMQTLNNRRCAIITEGEIDALSCYEAGFAKDYELQPDENGEVVEHDLGRWAVLSVPNGASKGNQRLEYLDNCSDFLSVIDEFILAVDNDEAGEQLKDELKRRLGVDKCRLIEYPSDNVVLDKNGVKRGCKDLNEVLIHFGVEKVRDILLSSELPKVEGIFYLEDVFPSMLQKFRNGVQLAPSTRFGEFDDFFRWKKGDINLFTGYANAGKTFFALQLMLTKSVYDGWKWAVFSPENYPADDFYDDLVEMYSGKYISLMTEDEYIKACDFINSHIIFVYPENEHDLNSIHDKFRYLILKKGIDGVMIDPFNQLDKEQKPYERDDQYLSLTLKEIKRFALTNGVIYNIVTHPKNPTYGANKELPVVGMYDLAGGAMWGNKVDQILSYHRPNIHIDKNDPNVIVHIQKVKRKRTGGKLGEFSIKLVWSTRRFCDSNDNYFLDIDKAEKMKFAQNNNIIENPYQNTLKIPERSRNDFSEKNEDLEEPPF